jgi:hypothetical protein
MLALAWLAVVFFQWIDATINQCIVCSQLCSITAVSSASWLRDVKSLLLTFVAVLDIMALNEPLKA